MDEVIECSKGHGVMIQRKPGTPEQQWCGAWYDCPPGPPGATCGESVLVPSAGLLAFHESLRDAQGVLDLEAS